jgi:hypothetical protein
MLRVKLTIFKLFKFTVPGIILIEIYCSQNMSQFVPVNKDNFFIGFINIYRRGSWILNLFC